MHEVFFVFGYARTVHLICWLSWYPCNFSDFIYFVPVFFAFHILLLSGGCSDSLTCPVAGRIFRAEGVQQRQTSCESTILAIMRP